MSGSITFTNIETKQNNTQESSLFSQLVRYFSGWFSSNNEQDEQADNSSNTDNHTDYEDIPVFSDEENNEDPTDKFLENEVNKYQLETEGEEDEDEYYSEDMRTITFRFYMYGKEEIDNGPFNYTTISAQSMMSQRPLMCTRFLYKYENTYYDIISNGKNARVISTIQF